MAIPACEWLLSLSWASFLSEYSVLFSFPVSFPLHIFSKHTNTHTVSFSLLQSQATPFKGSKPTWQQGLRRPSQMEGHSGRLRVSLGHGASSPLRGFPNAASSCLCVTIRGGGMILSFFLCWTAICCAICREEKDVALFGVKRLWTKPAIFFSTSHEKAASC